MTYANVMSTIAVFGVLGTGGAYAADTIGSSDIIDESILSQDIKDLEVQTSDLRNSSVTSLKINNGSVLNAEIGPNAVDGSKVLDGAIANAELADNSIGSGEVVDFALSNQDVGVLFAEVNAAGGVNNSAGATVDATRIGAVGTGQYEVDFGRNISLCAAVVTLGPAGTGSTVVGEVNVSDARRRRRGRDRRHEQQHRGGPRPAVPAHRRLLREAAEAPRERGLRPLAT